MMPMKKPKAVKKCECGGRIIYQHSFGIAFSFCDKCTPVQKVNVGKLHRAKTKNKKGRVRRERTD